MNTMLRDEWMKTFSKRFHVPMKSCAVPVLQQQPQTVARAQREAEEAMQDEPGHEDEDAEAAPGMHDASGRENLH